MRLQFAAAAALVLAACEAGPAAPNPEPARFVVKMAVRNDEDSLVFVKQHMQLHSLVTDGLEQVSVVWVQQFAPGEERSHRFGRDCVGTCVVRVGVTVRYHFAERSFVLPADTVASAADSVVVFAWPGDTLRAVEVQPPASNQFPVWPPE